ncbi:MAG TPA: hypothetical protein VE377_24780 [Candidatus Dormibacteraeota bacterium]|nr:hypothetical protein [Candidatus Dormibacteraeota bacterium]
MSQRNFAKVCRTLVTERLPIVCLVLVVSCVALAQQAKSGPAKAADLTGRYEGTAKNKAEEVITLAFELTEKDGALSGMIRSSHGDFPITGGTHKGDAVTIEFDAGGPGTITLRLTDDMLTGTWTAGEDGGPVDVKKAAAQEAPKGK